MTIGRLVYRRHGASCSPDFRSGFLTFLIFGFCAWQPAFAEEVLVPRAIEQNESVDEMANLDGAMLEVADLRSHPIQPNRIPALPAAWDLSTVQSVQASNNEPAIVPPLEGGKSHRISNPYSSLGGRMSAVKWEVGGIFAYMTVSQIAVTKETRSFHFQDEGWFGKNTANLGVDKLTHAFNSYLLAELFQARIARKTGEPRGAAVPAALLASGLMFYSELYDAHKVSSGFSYQDVVFNTAGAAFSALRHTIPGMEEKVNFKLLLIPNSDIYTFKGKRHYEQQRFLLSLQLAGFKSLKNSPFRLLELQVGYRAKGFTAEDIARGETPKRKIFYGIGLNLSELLFKSPKSDAEKVADRVLDYIQVPYTAAHIY